MPLKNVGGNIKYGLHSPTKYGEAGGRGAIYKGTSIKYVPVPFARQHCTRDLLLLITIDTVIYIFVIID